MLFSIHDSQLGPFALVHEAALVRGLELQVPGQSLHERIAQLYPAALEGVAPQPLVDQATAVLNGDATDLPISPQGTPFQHEVWQALRTVPAGQSRSYAQLAAMVGRPRAVRAVASACAANRVAVVIPCHRIVSSNGQMGCYRWGVAAKQKLLEREGRCGSTRS